MGSARNLESAIYLMPDTTQVYAGSGSIDLKNLAH
jgi:hypothetical protein